MDATTWPPERLQKAARNYAMADVTTILQELVASVGPADAAYLGGVTGRLIGMQYYTRTAELLLTTSRRRRSSSGISSSRGTWWD